jgi:hypothetical protein
MRGGFICWESKRRERTDDRREIERERESERGEAQEVEIEEEKVE